MTTDDIKAKLNELAGLRSAGDALNLQKQELIDSVLTPEIRAKVAEIEAEFAGKGAEAKTNADNLEAEIKQAVISSGASVKADYLYAVWNKGRTTWDSDLLKGYALAHPEINACRHVGEPTCTIRGV